MALKARLFNRKAASCKSKPDEILKTLDLRKGDRVADIGSGGGYFSLRFAQIVGDSGAVFAVDVDSSLLEHVGSEAKEAGLRNIHTVAVSGELKLPEKMDIAFMRNMYHHLEDRATYLKGLGQFLKPKGRLVIIDYSPKKEGKFSFRRIFDHSVPRERILSEAKEAGFNLMDDYDFLPEQNFLVFSKE